MESTGIILAGKYSNQDAVICRHAEELQRCQQETQIKQINSEENAVSWQLQQPRSRQPTPNCNWPPAVSPRYSSANIPQQTISSSLQSFASAPTITLEKVSHFSNGGYRSHFGGKLFTVSACGCCQIQSGLLYFTCHWP